jgi:SAM-dependent methyltransferase
MPGIHGIAWRLGWKSLRTMAFDAKYRNGTWHCTVEEGDLLPVIEKYAATGKILALGCGTGRLATFLKPGFESFVGVDLSPEAIATASQLANERVRFEVGDMTTYECRQTFDVILFAESIYYVNARLREKLLRRLSQSLSPQGKIVVSISHPQRCTDIIEMIRREFRVAVDLGPPENARQVMAFH